MKHIVIALIICLTPIICLADEIVFIKNEKASKEFQRLMFDGGISWYESALSGTWTFGNGSGFAYDRDGFKHRKLELPGFIIIDYDPLFDDSGKPTMYFRNNFSDVIYKIHDPDSAYKCYDFEQVREHPSLIKFYNASSNDMIVIDGKKWSKSTIKEALKQYSN